MPLHDDEMKRRREKREAMRKKQQAQTKQLRIRLGLTALVVAVCIGGIGYLAAYREKLGIASAPKPTEAVAQSTEPLSPLLADPITKIHIKAAGDLNVTDSVVSSGIAATGYDFTGVFRDVAYALPFVHAVQMQRAILKEEFANIFPHIWWVLGYAAAALTAS